MPVQETDHLIDRFSVLFLGDISLTGRIALLDMIVQAGSLFPGVPGQIPVAAPDMIQLMDQIDRIPDCLRTGVGSEIFCLVLQHLPRKDDSGKWFISRHFDERICLIIHEHGIVFRPVFLDQITLQDQRLKL